MTEGGAVRTLEAMTPRWSAWRCVVKEWRVLGAGMDRNGPEWRGALTRRLHGFTSGAGHDSSQVSHFEPLWAMSPLGAGRLAGPAASRDRMGLRDASLPNGLIWSHSDSFPQWVWAGRPATTGAGPRVGALGQCRGRGDEPAMGSCHGGAAGAVRAEGAWIPVSGHGDDEWGGAEEARRRWRLAGCRLARPEGFEPTTLGSEDRCSIH